MAPGSRAAVVVAGACTAVLGALAAFHTAGSASSAGPGAVEAWQAAIHDPIQHWGRIEILGMRPAISDLRAGTGVPAVSIAGEARAWTSGLQQIRTEMRAAEPPPGLAPAANLFDQALGMYLQAAATVERAAEAPPSTRIGLIDVAVRTAMRADCVYDSASVELQQVRRATGLGTTMDFPDHTCPAAVGGGG